MTITTSIIIPAYNEEARLARGFARLSPVLNELGATTTEVIFIDDGSTDATLKIAHDLYGGLPEKLLMQQPKNLGKGYGHQPSANATNDYAASDSCSCSWFSYGERKNRI